ncbi:MAG: GIY-YIG nuclease family protein [Halanaerobiales bacterium]
MKKNTVYCIINKINNMKYVGATKNPSARWKSHKQTARGTHSLYGKQPIHYAMMEFGIDNFEYQILETNIDEENINNRECYWIEKMDSFNNGYNCNTKGFGGAVGKYNGMYGISLSGEKNGMFGKGHLLKGENNGKSVLNLEKALQILILSRKTDLTHSEIGQIFSVSKCPIGQIIRGKHWTIRDYKEEDIEEMIKEVELDDRISQKMSSL